MPRKAKVIWHKTRLRWYANIGERSPDGRAKEVFAPTTIGKKDEHRAWEWLAKELERRATKAPPDDTSFDWLAERYLAWAEENEAGEMANWSRHLGIASDIIGSRAVSALDAEDVTAMGEYLLKGYSPTYTRNVLSTVRAVFQWAVKQKLIPGNPIRGYRSPTIPRSPIRFAERAEAAAFLAFWRTWEPRQPRKGGQPFREPWRCTVRGRYERYTLLLERCLIRTGARPKELCQLQWSDITWDGWKSSAGHACAKAVIPPDRWKTGKKTGKPRTIYFTPMLTHALRRLHTKAPNPIYVFVKAGGKGGRGKDEPWPSGSSLSRVILKVRRALVEHLKELKSRAEAQDPTLKAWELRRAQVTVLDQGHQRLVNYRFRHTAISTLLMLGIDIPTVAELTGTSPDMIYKFYGHLNDAHLSSAVEKTIGKKR